MTPIYALDAIKGFLPAVALRALLWSIELTNAVLDSKGTGRALETLLDLGGMGERPGLEEVLGALPDIEPDVLTAERIAQAP